MTSDSGALADVAYSFGTRFEQAAATARDACPVSKLFNAEITLETHVES